MKTKRIIALAIAVLTLTMAFAPAALAWTNSPANWSAFPQQSTSSSAERYTKLIQIMLNYYDSANLTVDGVYGSGTKGKVKTFQQHKGFTGDDVDGIVGKNTWTALRTCLYDYANIANGNLPYSTQLPENQIMIITQKTEYVILKYGSTTWSGIMVKRQTSAPACWYARKTTSSDWLAIGIA